MPSLLGLPALCGADQARPCAVLCAGMWSLLDPSTMTPIQVGDPCSSNWIQIEASTRPAFGKAFPACDHRPACTCCALPTHPCPLLAPQIVRYYEAVARWPLAASPSKSRGLGFLLRSHLRNGCALARLGCGVASGCNTLMRVCNSPVNTCLLTVVPTRTPAALMQPLLCRRGQPPADGLGLPAPPPALQPRWVLDAGAAGNEVCRGGTVAHNEAGKAALLACLPCPSS